MKELVENTQKKVTYFNSQVNLFGIVFYKTAEVLALGGVGGWLIYSSKDKVTIGVGVALALWSLVKLVGLAYRAESFKNGSPRV